MKLFNRKDSIDSNAVSYDESDEKIDRLKNLLDKASQIKKEEQKDEEQRLLNSLKLLSDQIRTAKAEYETVIAQLTPVKWELVDKKTKFLKLQSDYEALLSRIMQAKLELESITNKINSLEKKF